MPVVDTANLGALTGSEKHQIYCGIDTCIMPEILDEMNDLPCRARAESTYLFERQLQAPYLDMMMRGFRVNLAARDRALTALIARRDALQEKLDYLARALWDKGLNPRSQPQLQEFFYNVMNIPQVWIWQKGEKKLSMNREALEKIEEYLFARPFVSLILSIRDIAKDSEVLETQIDSDGRMRTSYQIARTVSGRASSEKSATGSGRNMQNIQGNLRYIFIADVGKKLGHVDEEQVEARDVGWFCGTKVNDWSFLDSCEGGDLHTSNARLVWPERQWTGDLKKDRNIAEEKFYRDMSFRDMSKRGGHLSHYMGQAHTAARHLKVPVEVMENFQMRYIYGGPGITPAFPCIEKWWGVEIRELETTMKHTNPFGRERQFFGRVTSPEVHREAIADLPQGTTADRTNRWLLNSWRGCPDIQVLAQTHDSFTFQYDDRGPEYEGEIMKYVLEELRKVELRDGKSGRRYSVPGEAKVGWNWGNESKGNPLGLRKWSPNMRDDRERPSVHFVK